MKDDPYKILGIGKNATDTDIKSAYRQLAKKYHPDHNKNNPDAASKFQDVSKAYDVLGDKQKRKAFDNGEIDINGNPTYAGMHAGAGGGFHGGFSDGSPRGGGSRYSYSSHADADFNDIFGSFFGSGAAQEKKRSAFRDIFDQEDADTYLKLNVDFLDSAKGAVKKVGMPDGKTIEITIPEGVKDGQKLKLSGKGKKRYDGKHGDAYVTISVRPHAVYERKDNNIYADLPIGLHEAVLGGTVVVDTIHGSVNMKIPAGTNSGTMMKLKGKGIKGGDHFARIKIVMPQTIDRELERFMTRWAKGNAYNPRKK